MVQKLPQSSSVQLLCSAMEIKHHKRAKLKAMKEKLMSRFAVLEGDQQVSGLSRRELDVSGVTTQPQSEDKERESWTPGAVRPLAAARSQQDAMMKWQLVPRGAEMNKRCCYDSRATSKRSVQMRSSRVVVTLLQQCTGDMRLTTAMATIGAEVLVRPAGNG